MKKRTIILVLSILIMLLYGCTENDELSYTKNELVKDYGFNKEDELIEYIRSHFDKNQSYSMGNGIIILDLDTESNEEFQVFPVYCDDELIFLVLYEDNTIYCSDMEVLEFIEKNNEYVILKADNNTYCASKKKLLLINGEKKNLSSQKKKVINKIRSGTIDINLMGIEKRTIRIVSEKENQITVDETKCINDKIIIRFTGDNINNKIRMYEAFCHGRVEGPQSNDGTYVFCFEPLNSNDLRILLDASNGLGYVLNASLIEKTEPVKSSVEPAEAE